MKRLLAILLFSGTAFAGTSAVTATITDSDSQTWNSGKWTATLNSPNGPPTISGVRVTATFFSGSLSSSGVLTQTMTDTSTLDQSGATWCFVITPNASATAGGTCLAVTGATPNLSTALSASVKAPRFAPGLSAYGYLDAEITNSVLGSSYYNVTTPCYRQFSQSGWGCGPTGGTQTINGTIPIVASTSGSTTTVSCPTCGLGTPVYVDGVLRAMKYIDNSGTLRKVDIYNDPSVADYADGSVTGTFEWAINLLGTNGGLVSCYPGIYTTLTPLVIDWDWITIQGVNKPTWDNSGPAWPTHATPGTPGGCQITTPNAIQMVNIGTTLANMHGDSRHKAIKLNSLYFYGQYTATYGVYDMSHADSMEISGNLFQGFQTEAIDVAWDSHQIIYNSIQNNTGNGIDEQGMYGQIIGNITYDLGGTGIVVNAGAAQRQALIEGNSAGNVNVCIQLNGGSSVVQGNTLNANCGAISGVQNNGGTNQIYGNWWGGDNFFWHNVANGPFQVYGGSSFGQMQILSDTANTETDVYFNDNLSHTGGWLLGLNIFGSSKHMQMGSNISGSFLKAFDLDNLGNLAILNSITSPTYLTGTNCASAASPAICGSAAAGSVLIPTGTTSSTLTVNTTAVTANSQIIFYPDDSLGTRLGVTCNSTLATLSGGSFISARTPGTSFTITFNGSILTNGVCGSYYLLN